MIRRAALTAVLISALGGLVAARPAAAATARPPVVVVFVRDSTWAMMPPTIEPWAIANLSLHSATNGEREMDSYLSIGKGGRTSGLGTAVGEGRVDLRGGRLQLLDWPAFVAHDHKLRFPGRLGQLGQALRDQHVSFELIVAADLEAAGAVADRAGVVDHVTIGGSLAVDAAVARRTPLVVVESDYTAVPSILEAAGASCTVVMSSSTSEHSVHLGAFAISPACGLGQGRLHSASTRQTDFVVLADVAPTILHLVGAAPASHMEGNVLEPAPGHRSISALLAEDRRARVTRHAERPFIGLLVVAALAGLVTMATAEDRRKQVAAILLALPVATFLIDVVPWWRVGVVAGLASAIALAVGLAAVARRLFGDRQAAVTAALAGTTAVVLGLDAATGGRLQLDSALANNALGAGRFTGMGNVPYGFFVAACIVLAALALDRWGRRGLPVAAAIAAGAVVVDGAPMLGADVGGVLAAVPAFGLLLATWRRSLPVRRLLPVLVGGVVVVTLFAAFDLSRPVDAQTHLARALSGGSLAGTVLRREINALHSFGGNPFLAVLALALLGAWLQRDRLPSSRPLRVGLWALALVALLGTFVNDSGVAVGGAVAAMAWPAYLLLLLDPSVRPPRPPVATPAGSTTSPVR
ncbi:MAG: rane protein of unknown function [Actinomycetia bacterium]|nr:rane protein of unknown function [Actinomycetes bacterium]